jgi:hypothetical protein
MLGVMVAIMVSRVGVILGPYSLHMVASSMTPCYLKRAGRTSSVSCVASAMPMLSVRPTALTNLLCRRSATALRAALAFLLRVLTGRANLTIAAREASFARLPWCQRKIRVYH